MCGVSKHRPHLISSHLITSLPRAFPPKDPVLTINTYRTPHHHNPITCCETATSIRRLLSFPVPFPPPLFPSIPPPLLSPPSRTKTNCRLRTYLTAPHHILPYPTLHGYTSPHRISPHRILLSHAKKGLPVPPLPLPRALISSHLISSQLQP